MLSRLGKDHRRQRSVLAPSFSPSHIRDLYPKFLETAQVVGLLRISWSLFYSFLHLSQLVEKLQCIIKNNPGGNSKEIEITPWLQRATLDVIGMGKSFFCAYYNDHSKMF